MAARELPLRPPGAPRYTVWFAPELEDALSEHPNAEDLVDELEQVLGIESHLIPGKRVEKLKGHPGLLKYRPHAANDVRFIFAREDHFVVVLAMFPRRKNYRRQDLLTAERRMESFGAVLLQALKDDSSNDD